jgi:hypothetical protein
MKTLCLLLLASLLTGCISIHKDAKAQPAGDLVLEVAQR